MVDETNKGTPSPVTEMKHWDAEEYIVLNSLCRVQRLDWPVNHFVFWDHGALKIYLGSGEPEDYTWTNKDIAGLWQPIK